MLVDVMATHKLNNQQIIFEKKQNYLYLKDSLKLSIDSKTQKLKLMGEDKFNIISSNKLCET